MSQTVTIFLQVLKEREMCLDYIIMVATFDLATVPVLWSIP